MRTVTMIFGHLIFSYLLLFLVLLLYFVLIKIKLDNLFYFIFYENIMI